MAWQGQVMRSAKPVRGEVGSLLTPHRKLPIRANGTLTHFAVEHCIGCDKEATSIVWVGDVRLRLCATHYVELAAQNPSLGLAIGRVGSGPAEVRKARKALIRSGYGS